MRVMILIGCLSMLTTSPASAAPSGACNKMIGKSIQAVGGFAHDRGCILTHFEIDGKRYHRGKATQAALRALGWKKAKKKKRLELVRTWVLDGLLAFEGTIVETRPKGRGFDAFKPPTVVATKKGYRVTVWVKGPTGMRCGNYFGAQQVDIDRSGKLISSKETTGFFRPC